VRRFPLLSSAPGRGDLFSGVKECCRTDISEKSDCRVVTQGRDGCFRRDALETKEDMLTGRGSSNKGAIVAIDVGGTNTDIIMTMDGRESCYKLPSTKTDPSIATIQGIVEMCQEVGIGVDEIGRVLHGTTVATNAVIEHKLGKIGMITTEGFRDILAIGRHRKEYNFSIHQDVLQERYPLVERRLIKTVRERMVAPGVEETPLDEEQVRAVTGELVREGVESIAVCYLFSFLNPAHEDRTKEIIRERYPGIYVATSNGVAPVFREWYRFSTTVISCCLMKLFSTYVSTLETRMSESGVRAGLLLVQSNGGMSSTEEAQAKPVNFLYSGPAGGALEVKSVMETVGEENAIGLDMGGTSCDIVVIHKGRLPERDPRDAKVGGYPVTVSMLDIETIGAGGSSISWVDEGGGFNVGPMSAGAEPGPACYGRGGEHPTVTDAQLVLRRLSPETFLGGAFKVDENFSNNTMKQALCDRLRDDIFSDVYRAAMAIVELVNFKMAQALRNQTIRRGYDPRQFALVPFGGAGPVHACDLAEIIGISKIIVPRWPGIGSARGFLTTDIKYSHAHTVNILLEAADSSVIEGILERHKRAGERELERSGIPKKRMRFQAYLDCMYQGQGYELSVGLKSVRQGWKEHISKAFFKRHMEEYGHAKVDPLKIVNVKLEAIGLIDKPKPVEVEEGGTDASHAIRANDRVYFGSARDLKIEEVARYAYENLKANNIVLGPAIVDEKDSTIVVKRGWQAAVTRNGYLVLSSSSKP